MIQVSWTRHSIRQKGVSIPMSGFVGSYAITQGANQFIEYLRFGEFFGVGSKANLGMGGVWLGNLSILKDFGISNISYVITIVRKGN